MSPSPTPSCDLRITNYELRHVALLFLLIAALVAPLRAADIPSTATLRIISCAPNLTEMVFALGAGPQVIGVSTFTNHPPEAVALPPVADLFSPNLEAMIRLKPNMVIGLQSSRKVFDFFESRPDVRTVQLGELETLAQIDEAIRIIGAALGREPEAEALLAAQPKIASRPAPAQPPRVLWVVGHGPGLSQLYAVGHGTYITELLMLAGAVNVVPEASGKYPVLNKEALLRLNPDIIIYTADGEQAAAKRLAEARRDWAPLRTIPAVRRGDYRMLPDSAVLIPGPRARGYLPVIEELLSRQP